MYKDLFEFIKKSPTAYQTVESAVEILENAGFLELKENESWTLQRSKGTDGKYYVNRNGSSIIAFTIGTECGAFRITASHSDSPAFKLKENCEITVKDKYIQLNTEGYGGMICYSWMDRPLSLAGRVIVKEDGKLVQKNVQIDRDLLLIPSLAIHMNRKVNEGVEFNKQVDMLPLFGAKDEGAPAVRTLIADELQIEEESILGWDMYLYNRAPGSVWGRKKEYISAPRLDDLMCAYTSLMAFADQTNDKDICVYALFDNEEVGSDTRQGAGSSFLEDTLDRIADALGVSSADKKKMLATSFMVSEDNGHAVHPNHPEKTDATNCVYMNGGIVVKSHAGQKYSTDGYGIALCRQISENADIPIQFYSNRSDEAGGSTLGNIASCRTSVRTVDIGLAQLAMHSSYETAGKDDVEYMYRFNKAFYECDRLW